jgi:hypothetical protein
MVHDDAAIHPVRPHVVAGMRGRERRSEKETGAEREQGTDPQPPPERAKDEHKRERAERDDQHREDGVRTQRLFGQHDHRGRGDGYDDEREGGESAHGHPHGSHRRHANP